MLFPESIKVGNGDYKHKQLEQQEEAKWE